MEPPPAALRAHDAHAARPVFFCDKESRLVMAKVSAPFLSLGASGTIGDTLVAATWKGQKYMRQHVTPANPKSPTQIERRDLMKACTIFWRTHIATPALITGWNTAAKLRGLPHSGFNVFTRNALTGIALSGVSAGSVTIYMLQEGVSYFDCYSILSPSSDPLAGTYTLFYGPTPTSLLSVATYESTKHWLNFSLDLSGLFCRINDPTGRAVTGVVLVPAS